MLLGGSGGRSRYISSVARATWFIISTASQGYWPMAVSPDSMQASPPSMMALAMSVTSARVGRREFCMLSSICVAMITGFCCRWQAAMICFCTIGMRATSISTPKSPRATITPSAAMTISSNCCHGLGLFDLGDHLGRRTALGQQIFQLADVGRLADKTQADEVDAVVGRPAGMLAVVVVHRRRAELGAGQIQPLPAADQARLNDLAADAVLSLSSTNMLTAPSASMIVSPTFNFVDQQRIGGDQLLGLAGWSPRMK